MNTYYSSLAIEKKHKSIIDMSLTFSAMMRLFEKGSKQEITNELFDEVHSLENIESREDFEFFHRSFCDWFTRNIRTTQRIRNNRIVREAHYAYYGHAAKVLDVSLKVIVYYSGLPNIKYAEKILPFLHCAVDTPLLNYLKSNFPSENIIATTIEKIDRTTYKRLQDLIRNDIRRRFNNEINPTQYDDIMWYELNR